MVEIAAHSRIITAIDLHPTTMLVSITRECASNPEKRMMGSTWTRRQWRILLLSQGGKGASKSSIFGHEERRLAEDHAVFISSLNCVGSGCNKTCHTCGKLVERWMDRSITSDVTIDAHWEFLLQKATMLSLFPSHFCLVRHRLQAEILYMAERCHGESWA